MTTAGILTRVRKLCLSLPETTERLSHGAPCFYVGTKKTFVMFLNNHHDDGRLALWCAAPLGAQESLIALDAEQFFRPPYVGHRGWIGVRLDLHPNWDQVAGIIRDAWHTVAPAKLAARHHTA